MPDKLLLCICHSDKLQFSILRKLLEQQEVNWFATEAMFMKYTRTEKAVVLVQFSLNIPLSSPSTISCIFQTAGWLVVGLSNRKACIRLGGICIL